MMLGSCCKSQCCDYALVNVSLSKQRDFSCFLVYTTEAVEENENLWLCNVTEYDTKLQCRCSYKGHARSPVLISGFEYCYIVF